jgi:uncharacterized protein (DUF2141 family)
MILRLLLFGLVCSLGMFPHETFGADKTDITVTVTGFSSTVGKVRMILFSAAEGFPSQVEKGVWNTSREITGKSMEVKIPSVDVGRYAIAVLHDADGDGKVKANILGIPKEGTGVTRDVRPAMRAPQFDECAMDFTVGAQTVTIALVYP